MNKLEQYIERFSTVGTEAEEVLLAELDRATNLRVVQPKMVSGRVQGAFLRLVVEMLRPRSVLEIGTFTGYSALSMAAGLEPGARLHTIEVDDELEDTARGVFGRSAHGDKIHLHIGSALEVVPRLVRELNEAAGGGGEKAACGGFDGFDLVFIDGDKREYPDYLRMLMGDANREVDDCFGANGSGANCGADDCLGAENGVGTSANCKAGNGVGIEESITGGLGDKAENSVSAGANCKTGNGLNARDNDKSDSNLGTGANYKAENGGGTGANGAEAMDGRANKGDVYRSNGSKLGVEAMVHSGSVILADNVLWYGKVAEPELIKAGDKMSRGILEFNRLVAADPRVENVIVPLRDGINMIRVK